MIRAIFIRLRSVKRSASSRIWRLRAVAQSFLAGARLSWPSTVAADAPVRVDGGGSVVLEDNVHLGYYEAPRIGSGEILLQARSPAASISVGAGTTTSNNVSIIAMDSVGIGRDCRIGDMTLIIDCDFHEVDPDSRDKSAGACAPVTIGDNVWLGSRVIVLKGVTIGNNSVIAAGSIVTKPLPANSLAAGVPARVIRDL